MKELTLLLMKIKRLNSVKCKMEDLSNELSKINTAPLWDEYSDDFDFSDTAEDRILEAIDDVDTAVMCVSDLIKAELIEASDKEEPESINPYEGILYDRYVREFLEDALSEEKFYYNDILLNNDDAFDMAVDKLSKEKPGYKFAENLLNEIITEVFPCEACHNNVEDIDLFELFVSLIMDAAVAYRNAQ